MEGGGGGGGAEGEGERRTAVHPVVDLVHADQRVAARQDRGSPRARSQLIDVVLDDALGVVADEDADALAPGGPRCAGRTRTSRCPEVVAEKGKGRDGQVRGGVDRVPGLDQTPSRSMTVGALGTCNAQSAAREKASHASLKGERHTCTTQWPVSDDTTDSSSTRRAPP